MTEEQAVRLAAALVAMETKAEAWNSGGNIWLVLIERKDGSLVCFSDENVIEYANWDRFYAGGQIAAIELDTPPHAATIGMLAMSLLAHLDSGHVPKDVKVPQCLFHLVEAVTEAELVKCRASEPFERGRVTTQGRFQLIERIELDNDSNIATTMYVLRPYGTDQRFVLWSEDLPTTSTDLADPDAHQAAMDKRPKCPDCGEPGERKGHMGCQYPSDTPNG